MTSYKLLQNKLNLMAKGTFNVDSHGLTVLGEPDAEPHAAGDVGVAADILGDKIVLHLAFDAEQVR